MFLAIGLALLGLTLYISALTYTMRAYSRSRLSERLSDADREPWLDWLDRHEGELQTLTSLLRLVLSLGVLLTVWAAYDANSRRPMDLVTGAIATVVSVALLAVFAVGVPHALAVHAGEGILCHGLRVLAVIRVALWPLGRLFEAVEFVVRRLLGKADVTAEQQTERHEQEIMDAVSEGEAHGAVDEDQKEMIESVFELSETPVSTIMTPRTDIDALPATSVYDDIRKLIVTRGHSRIPVFDGSIDHIVGVVYAKDLLRLDPAAPFDVRKVMRVVPYVPEAKTLDELLDEFRATKVQMAIVLDEYGGTAGLVTIEDILEELVGEIHDEYDRPPPPPINRLDADTLEVDGRVRISEINEELGIELPDEADYDTIAGFVFATLGRIPAAGEEFQHDHVRFRVTAAEPRKIRRLRVHVEREKAETA